MLDEAGPLFQGSEVAARAFLRGQGGDGYYTYLLLRPDGRPFYVGKGKGDRVFGHEREALRQSLLPTSNPFKCNTIRAIRRHGGSIGYGIDRLFAKEDQLLCLQREEELIACYRRRCDGGILTNLAAGLGSLAERDPFSAERHRATLSGLPEDRPERAALNIFLRTLGGVDSVPIKPLSEYRPRLVRSYPNPNNRTNLTRRNGLTVAATAVASGQRLQPGVRLPRAFTVVPDPDNWPLASPPPAEVAAVIENGAIGDILKLRLATLIPAEKPEDERLHLDSAQVAALVGLMSRPWFESLDLL